MKYSKWVIPSAVAAQTERALLMGQHEVFCMWTAAAGNAVSDEATGSAEVLRCVVPAQTPGETPSGVWVHIAGQELQRIQMDNYHRQERSIVQLHSHPGANVQMSELDREWEVVRPVGALSIIVPFYGRGGLRLHGGANIYEREANDWRLWSQAEAAERLVLA